MKLRKWNYEYENEYENENEIMNMNICVYKYTSEILVLLASMRPETLLVWSI